MADTSATKREPLTDPKTGKPLAPKQQPGYYPGFNTMSQQRYWDAETRRVVGDRVNNIKPIRFFSAEQQRTMEALAERIMPQDDRTEDRRIPIVPDIDHRLAVNSMDGYRYDDMPPDQEAYQIALRAFELMAQRLRGCRFDELSTMDQEQLIQSVHDGNPAEAREEWQKMNVERFWAILVGDMCSVYYAHPWAWDEIGFGGPAYPRGYMRLENGEPEPWEVREKAYQWQAPADTISDKEETHTAGHQTTPGQGGTH